MGKVYKTLQSVNQSIRIAMSVVMDMLKVFTRGVDFHKNNWEGATV